MAAVVSLAEDARRLMAEFEGNTGLALQGGGDNRACRICKVRVTYHEDAPCQRHHAAHCLVLSLPQIVAVLEAAERLPNDERIVAETGSYIAYAICEGDALSRQHAPDCAYQALMAALRGDVLTGATH